MENYSMIDEIIDFVSQHKESTASVSVWRRILGFYPEEVNSSVLADLRNGLEKAEPDEVEACYYIIK